VSVVIKEKQTSQCPIVRGFSSHISNDHRGREIIHSTLDQSSKPNGSSSSSLSRIFDEEVAWPELDAPLDFSRAPETPSLISNVEVEKAS